MNKFLINSTIQYVVDSMSEADELEQNIRANHNYDVVSFAKKQKVKRYKEKVGKETLVSEEPYVLCTVKMSFNDEKFPCVLNDLVVKSSTGILSSISEGVVERCEKEQKED